MGPTRPSAKPTATASAYQPTTLGKDALAFFGSLWHALGPHTQNLPLDRLAQRLCNGPQFTVKRVITARTGLARNGTSVRVPIVNVRAGNIDVIYAPRRGYDLGLVLDRMPVSIHARIAAGELARCKDGLLPQR